MEGAIWHTVHQDLPAGCEPSILYPISRDTRIARSCPFIQIPEVGAPQFCVGLTPLSVDIS